MITIYTITYNESVFLQFFIDHYRSRFPNCNIIVYDNESTDNTRDIALKNGCEVLDYKTNNQIDDDKLRNVKNNCWKSAKTDWVCVCDADECLNINEQELKEEEANGITMIKAEGWNMVNMEDNYDLANIKYGSRCSPYDKFIIFNKKHIKEINYCHGAHSCSPIGISKKSDKKYLLYHYKDINPDYVYNRHVLYTNRMSDINKKNGWGAHYLASAEGRKNMMMAARTFSIKIIT
jgi:glycosyltransferase involved in cell wall biosynthesis